MKYLFVNKFVPIPFYTCLGLATNSSLMKSYFVCLTSTMHSAQYYAWECICMRLILHYCTINCFILYSCICLTGTLNVQLEAVKYLFVNSLDSGGKWHLSLVFTGMIAKSPQVYQLNWIEIISLNYDRQFNWLKKICMIYVSNIFC